MKERKKKKVRVFLGLLELAGYYSSLRQGLSDLGVDCVHFAPNRGVIDRYVQGEKQYWLLNLADDIVLFQSLHLNSRIVRGVVHRILAPLVQLLIFIWAVIRFDVFVFGFATSFFNLHDLLVLKLLRKKIIFVFHGSDSRPAYISGNFVHQLNGPNLSDCIQTVKEQKRRMRIIERYADVCINNPPGGHFHERPFINHNFIGHPTSFELPSAPQEDTGNQLRSFRILHAPSNPIPKGTPEVRAAVALLRKKGYDIELREIISRPNHEVLAALQWCDLVVDQVFSDIPFACFASEAAFAGKPVVVGGYAQDEFIQFAKKIGMPTTLFIRPENLESTIERLIVDSAFRNQCGIEARDFIHGYWTPHQVASRFLSIIKGEIPEEWWVDPNQLSYLHGWGGTEQQMQRYILEFLEMAGISALQLSDKPNLESSFVRFAHYKVK